MHCNVDSNSNNHWAQFLSSLTLSGNFLPAVVCCCAVLTCYSSGILRSSGVAIDMRDPCRKYCLPLQLRTTSLAFVALLFPMSLWDLREFSNPGLSSPADSVKASLPEARSDSSPRRAREDACARLPVLSSLLPWNQSLALEVREPRPSTARLGLHSPFGEVWQDLKWLDRDSRHFARGALGFAVTIRPAGFHQTANY